MRLESWLETLIAFLKTLTADGFLSFFGALFGVLITYLLVNRQIDSENKHFKESIAEEKKKFSASNKPMLVSIAESDRIVFKNNESIYLTLVNAGTTPALNIGIKIEMYRDILFGVNDNSDKVEIFDNKFGVIMPGKYLKIPVISSFDLSKYNDITEAREKTIFKNKSIFSLSRLQQFWSGDEQIDKNISFFVTMNYEDRQGEKIKKEIIVNISSNRMGKNKVKDANITYADYLIEQNNINHIPQKYVKQLIDFGLLR